MADKVSGIVLGFIAVLIGAVLVGPLQTTVADANITGTAGTIVALLPLFFGIGILLVTIRTMVGKG
jgi:hypothetical protein